MTKCVALWCLCAAAAPAADWKSGFLKTSDGVRLHYLEAGRGQAIVFQPGWTMPAEIWEPQIRGLAARYHVVALDPRAQGASEKTPEGLYAERRAADIKDAVDALHLAPAVLVGWSLGVPEVLTYVGRFGTSTVKAVVLVDGPLGSDAGPTRQGWAWMRQMQKDRVRFAGEFVRGMYRKPQPEEYLRRITAASLLTPTNSAVALMANMVMEGDWRSLLSKLDRPVLYAGTARMKVHAETLRKAVPAARVEIFEDCGHALFVDGAPRFNTVLERFLGAK